MTTATHAYATEGVHIERGVFDAQTADELKTICERILKQWRLAPQTDNPPVAPQANYLRHLNHPSYHVGRREDLMALLNAIGSPRIVQAVSDALGEPFLFLSFSLYFTPLGESLDGFWHKDKTGEEANDKVEYPATGSGLQLQIPLVSSSDLEVVPGSHVREYTAQERHICLDEDGAHRRSNDMPGALRLDLQPGDAAMFNQVTIHRGRYHRDRQRLTLMASFKKRAVAQQTLQRHGLDQYTDQPWFLEPGYLDGVDAASRPLFDDYYDFYAPKWRARLAEFLKYYDLVRRVTEAGDPFPFFGRDQ